MTNVKMSMNPFCEIAMEVGPEAAYLQNSCMPQIASVKTFQLHAVRRKLSDYVRRNLQKRS